MIPPEVAHGTIRAGYARAIHADGYGFPSGHVAGATLAWGSLATVLRVGTRRARIAAATTIVSLTALSRMVLGVHYLVDVVGGAVFGLLVLRAWWISHRRLERPAIAALATGIGCALLPVALGLGGSEPLYALGALGGILTAWLLVVDPDRSLEATPVGVGAAAGGIVAFLAVGVVVGSLLSGSIGAAAMTFAMGATIVSWPTAVGAVLE